MSADPPDEPPSGNDPLARSTASDESLSEDAPTSLAKPDKARARQAELLAKSNEPIPGTGPMVAAVVASHFSGPLPPPAFLRSYEEVHPGLAQKIISNWQAESEHRRARELQEQNHVHQVTKDQQRHEHRIDRGNARRQSRGQQYGRQIAFGGLLVVILLAWMGHPTTAGVFGVGVLVALVVVFVTGKALSRGEVGVPDDGGDADA